MSLQRAIDLLVKGSAYETPFDAQVIEEAAKEAALRGFMPEAAFREAAKGYPISTLLRWIVYARAHPDAFGRGGNKLGLFSFGNSGSAPNQVIHDVICVPGYDIEDDPSLVTLDFPDLIAIDPLGLHPGYLFFATNPNLQAVYVPKLAYVETDFFLTNNMALTTVYAPELVHVGGVFGIAGSLLLTAVSFPNWIPTDGTSINFFSCSLDAASIEAMLHQLVLAGVTTCTIDFSGGGNTGVSALSPAGQADAAALGAQLTMNG